jgi:alpha-tubulin suppressor-like RCC1 family protein
VWGLRIFAAVATVAALGCAKTNPYACTDSTQCILGGEPGVCEPHGFCSFADSECAGGWRFEPNAGNGLGGTCTDMAPPADARIDSPILPDAAMLCGGVGQMCCTEGAPACGDNGFCQAGTCAACLTDLAIGHRFSCFLKYDRTVWCAGQNFAGQLGAGDTGGPDLAMPVQVRDATGMITDATAAAAGIDFACAVRAGGSVWCWGGGDSGELGDGATLPAASDIAVRVIVSGGAPLANIVEIGAGYSHVCARDATGEVWCWGDNDGALGDGTTTSRNVAAKVLGSAGGAPFTGATKLVVGGDHACALKGSDAWCWGENYDGQLGNGTLTNVLVPANAGSSTAVGLGNEHSCWVRADSSVQCSGDNGHGVLGNGEGGDQSNDEEQSVVSVLAAVGGAPFTGVRQVFGGGANTCALMQDGRVACWGDNKYGQMGGGTASNTPRYVMRATATGAVQLTGAEQLLGKWTRYCTRNARGEYWCWGKGTSGEFGDNKYTARGFAQPLASGVTCP